MVVPAGGTLAFVVAPFLRELTLHRSATSGHLRLLNSYWYQDLSLPGKLSAFWRTYRRGLSPWYWFSPKNSPDLVRHVMKGMGHVWWPLLPFVVVGLVICVMHWRSSKHRVVLIALVSAPFSAAMVEVTVTRALVTVIPIAILACLGIDQVLRWIPRPDWRVASVSMVAVVLAGFTVGMTRNALTNGPVWFDNYGLYGMQWGASQVFEEVDSLLQDDDRLRVVVSPSWANNPNAFVPFFVGIDRRDRVSFQDVHDYVVRFTPIADDTVLVLNAEDYADMRASDKFDLPDPVFVLPRPNGTPGFFFVRPRYVADVQQRFADDRVERARLLTDTITMDGEVVTVKHLALDSGQIQNAFDGNDATVARGLNANPFVLELTYPAPRPVSEIKLVTQRLALGLVVVLFDPDGKELRVPRRPTNVWGSIRPSPFSFRSAPMESVPSRPRFALNCETLRAKTSFTSTSMNSPSVDATHSVRSVGPPVVVSGGSHGSTRRGCGRSDRAPRPQLVGQRAMARQHVLRRSHRGASRPPFGLAGSHRASDGLALVRYRGGRRTCGCRVWTSSASSRPGVAVSSRRRGRDGAARPTCAQRLSGRRPPTPGVRHRVPRSPDAVPLCAGGCTFRLW